MNHRDFLWRLYAAIGAAVFLFLLLAVFTILNITRVNEADQWTEQSYQVLVESIGLGESLANADTGARGFAITGQERFLAPLSAGRAEFPRHLHRVRRLTRDNPVQQERLRKLEVLYRRWTSAYIEPLLAVRRADGSSDIPPAVGQITLVGKPYADQMRSVIADINRSEQSLLAERESAANRRQRRALATLLIAGLFALGATAALSLVLVRNTRRMLAVNEEMRRAKEEAEAANGAKSEFLSRMSHELRTPLNAILGFGQLLELEEDKEENRESVEQILKAGRHLLSLIDEVLDLARIEAGRMSLSMEPTSVRQAVQQSLDLIRPMASQRGIRIVAEASTDCDLHVSADLQRLKQVLLNFLSNAIKYNREGGSVTISCVPHPMEGRVRIAVRDTGVGIEPAKLNRLFTPFERLDAERTDVEGTGLGLALSRGLMEAMGGVVGAESTRDEGSTFWLELPIVTEPALPEEAAPADVASATALGKQGHTVLYVEDNLSNLRLVERILTRRPDVQLLVALQGRIALELARQHRPDLILLDVHLPDLNGDAVLAELQRDPVLREIPVVVVSADATSGQIERLRRSGARDYLTKPLDVKRFLDVLDSTLDSVRAV